MPTMAPFDDIESGAAAPGEGTPLIQRGDDSVAAHQHDDDDLDPLGEVKECTNKEKVVGGAAAVAAATSVAAMVVESHPSVYVSGATGLVVAPYAAFQQQKMTDVEALQETNERMEQEVNKLKANNEKLQDSVGKLEKSAENLQDYEEALKKIRKTETKSLDRLEKQLDESKEILKKMKGNVKATVMQNLISCVLNCDKDGDKMLSDEEIDTLIQKIENIYGVDINDEKLKALIIGCNRSLYAVMEVGRNLLADDIPEDEKIFTFADK